MILLARVETVKNAEKVLFVLQQERPQESRISSRMPTVGEHCAFVRNHPYRRWFIVMLKDEPIGSIYAGYDNSIGVAIISHHRGRGYGQEAVRALMRMLRPLPAIASVRRGEWVANIALGNEASERFFSHLGFTKLQVVYAKREG